MSRPAACRKERVSLSMTHSSLWPACASQPAPGNQPSDKLGAQSYRRSPPCRSSPATPATTSSVTLKTAHWAGDGDPRELPHDHTEGGFEHA
jgi:hypothetical protein